MAGQSVMSELGISAPGFALPDVTSGKTVRLEDFAGKNALLVMFICRHCPYVQHIKEELGRISRDYKNSEIAIVAISSNDAVAYPADSPESRPSLRKRTESSIPSSTTRPKRSPRPTGPPVPPISSSSTPVDTLYTGDVWTRAGRTAGFPLPARNSARLSARY